MTVKELIEELQKHPDHLEILVSVRDAETIRKLEEVSGMLLSGMQAVLIS